MSFNVPSDALSNMSSALLSNVPYIITSNILSASQSYAPLNIPTEIPLIKPSTSSNVLSIRSSDEPSNMPSASPSDISFDIPYIANKPPTSPSTALYNI